jgi:hypothetical protein
MIALPARFSLVLSLIGIAFASSALTASAGRPVPVPVPIGVSPEYRLPASSAAVRAATPIGALACSRTRPLRFRFHLELFARRLVLPVPAGIGIAPPLRREGATCSAAAARIRSGRGNRPG